MKMRNEPSGRRCNQVSAVILDCLWGTSTSYMHVVRKHFVLAFACETPVVSNHGMTEFSCRFALVFDELCESRSSRE